MLDLNKLVAGRIYSFRHKGNVELKKRGLPNWLECATITAERAFKGNLANPESYGNKQRQLDPEWTPTGKPTWFEWTGQNGLVKHKTTGKPYLALVNPASIKTTYFVNGVEATEAQRAEIKLWKKSQGEFETFAVFDLEKVEHTGEVEA